METRRRTDISPSPASSRNAATIESARRFLYDEDEPPVPEPTTPQMTSHTNLSGADSSKRKNRLSPMMAPCLGALSSAWNTIKHMPRTRLMILAAGAAGLISLIVIFTSRGKGQTQHYSAMKDAILASGMSSQEVFNNERSPQYNAMRWLESVDKASPGDPFFLQLYALAVLFYSTSGTDEQVTPVGAWKVQTNWMTDKGYCSWFGVECGMKDPKFDGNDEITTLALPNNLLHGTLPSEIRSLSKLIVLDFTDNLLSSTIPLELLSMNSLQYLLLGKNQLQGSLPEDRWDDANNLRELDLGHNDFHGTLPIMLFLLTDLRKLGLEYNQFHGGLSNAVASLQRLSHLYLQGNTFTGPIPADLNSLTALVDFRLSENGFTGPIPLEFSQLTRIEYLYLSDNRFTGTIPPAIFSSMTRLMEVSFAGNNLGGLLPRTFGSLGDIRLFSVAGNKLSGSLPNEVFAMVDLRYFSIADNMISGTIPDLIDSWRDLEVFNVHNNRLSGPIPTYLGHLHTLQEIDLSGNVFTGRVPIVFNQLKDLKTFRVEHNQLTGSVPSVICKLTEANNLSILTCDCATGLIECQCCHKCY